LTAEDAGEANRLILLTTCCSHSRRKAVAAPDENQLRWTGDMIDLIQHAGRDAGNMTGEQPR